MTPAEMVYDYIDNNLSGIDLFIAKEPMTQNDCVTFYDMSGRDSLIGLDQSFDCNVFRPQVSCRSRAYGYESAYSNCQTVLKGLTALRYHEKNGYVLMSCMLSGDINAIGEDENNNQVVVMTLNCLVKRA